MGFFYNGTNGSAISGIANENLKWGKEQGSEYRYRLEFLESRLSLTFDYYTRTTSDLIFDFASICCTWLFSLLLIMHSSPQNVGELKNTGL